MSPESMIALFSAGAVALVLGGGYLLGHAKARGQAAIRIAQLKGELREARQGIKDAEKALAHANSSGAGEVKPEEDKLIRENLDDKTEKLREELSEARALLAKLEGSSDRISALEKERDTVLQRAERLERERGEARAELAKAVEEKNRPDPEKSVVAKTGETVKLITERDEARDRLAAAERLMEGVRARSNNLAAELKALKDELASLKKS